MEDVKCGKRRVIMEGKQICSKCKHFYVLYRCQYHEGKLEPTIEDFIDIYEYVCYRGHVFDESILSEKCSRYEKRED